MALYNPRVPEEFTPDERARLAPYFTNLDSHIFALTNLPETVKGALFARYSRSAKSPSPSFSRRVRRDRYDRELDAPRRLARGRDRSRRAAVRSRLQRLRRRLGRATRRCAHRVRIRVERPHKSARVGTADGVSRAVHAIRALHRQAPRSLAISRPRRNRPRSLRDEYVGTMDATFETYARWIAPMQEYFARRYPKSPAIRMASTARHSRESARHAAGMLPAATQSNVGIFGTGQAFEALLLRMRANPLSEVRACADQMLDGAAEGHSSISDARRSTGTRRPVERLFRRHSRRAREVATGSGGGRTGAARRGHVDRFRSRREKQKSSQLRSIAFSDLPDDQLLDIAGRLSADERLSVLRAYVAIAPTAGTSPGRAFERTSYRFDVLTDYGAFRDLQRHRLLTLEWQPLTPRHGFVQPEAIVEAGAHDDWNRVMERSARLYDAMRPG